MGADTVYVPFHGAQGQVAFLFTPMKFNPNKSIAHF